MKLWDDIYKTVVVPVVMEKCTTCHKGFKVGDTLGAISYKLPIQ